MKVNIKNPKISTSFKTERVYPELEDLEVTPTIEEQNFKSSKYGFDNITVKAVEGETLEVTPSKETQNFTGLYEEVNVKGIEGETLEITPTIEAQEHTGIFDKVNVKGIETEELNITPSIEEQIFTGLYDNVNVSKITSDLIPNLTPENIAEGEVVLDLVGNHKGGNTLPIELDLTNLNKQVVITTSGNNEIIANENKVSIYVLSEDTLKIEEIEMPDIIFLSYIQCTGTQYFDLGYIPNSATAIECKINISEPTNSIEVVFGSRPAYGNSDFSFWHHFHSTTYGNQMVLGYGTNTELRSLYPMYNDTAIITYKNRVLNIKRLDGSIVYSYTRATGSLTNAISMYLLSGNLKDSTPANCVTKSAKLYYFKVYENEVLKMDLVPAKRYVDGVIGLYDKVSEKFLTNKGTGTFIAGSAI